MFFFVFSLESFFTLSTNFQETHLWIFYLVVLLSDCETKSLRLPHKLEIKTLGKIRTEKFLNSRAIAGIFNLTFLNLRNVSLFGNKKLPATSKLDHFSHATELGSVKWQLFYGAKRTRTNLRNCCSNVWRDSFLMDLWRLIKRLIRSDFHRID